MTAIVLDDAELDRIVNDLWDTSHNVRCSRKAADAITTLRTEVAELGRENDLASSAYDVMLRQRDEALAEVERLRAQIVAMVDVEERAMLDRLSAPQPEPRDEIAEAARAGIIEAVLAADDVWPDYGSGWRLHMSFLPRSADLAHHFMALRALAGKDE